MSPQERTKAQKTSYAKYWRLKEKLSIGKNGLLLFEGKKVLKKGETKKKCGKKTFSKSKSVGYKKIRTQELDGYAGLRRNNILTVTSTDAKFKKFTLKFINKALPRPVTTAELSYHYIYIPIFILISSSLTEKTFVK